SSRSHLFIGLRNGFTSRRAIAVHRDCGNVVRYAGPQSDDTSNISSIRRLGHAAEYHLVNSTRVNARAGEQRVYGDAPQFVRAKAGEIGAHPREWRSNTINNNKTWRAHTFTSDSSAIAT